MSNDLEKYTFEKLIHWMHVRIPKIQRDYAQGRISRSVNGIRKDFTHALILVVKGKRSGTELDFIYGSCKNNAFEPLDGQQRLTTLFLLHWLLNIDLKTEDGKHSVFTYETRNTSREFCDELVLHSALKLVEEAAKKTKAEKEKFERNQQDAAQAEKEFKLAKLNAEQAKEKFKQAVKEAEQESTGDFKVIAEQAEQALTAAKKKEEEARKRADDAKASAEQKPQIIKTSDVIRCRDWFKFEWKSDPTILSMLVMIDAICDEMGDAWSMGLDVCRQNLSNITFHLLNLGDFGLSDELFIKMNARGKQLSDFDKLKSTLEEELQLQQSEKGENGKRLVTIEDENLWRTYMDGAWIDFFWHKYARDIIISTEQVADDSRQTLRLSAAKDAELKFKILILRLIALQLLEKSTDKKVQEAAYQIDEDEIDDLLSAYTDSLTELRSNDHPCTVPGMLAMIDFSQLMVDINHLIYSDSEGIFHEISTILAENTHIENNSKTLFESFLEARVSNDVELIFYAMLLFLRAYPVQNEEEIAHVADVNTYINWCGNIQDWVLVMRNILLNDNNNQRIDKIYSFLEAMQGLKELLDDLKSFVESENLNMYEDETSVLRFFDATDKTYKGLDNQSLAEERKKARLRLGDSAWQQAIEEAEAHPYLWGQIRCLLAWAQDDRSRFEDYRNRLTAILNAIDSSGRNFYAALLAFAPECWSKTNRLFQYNKDRDNSFKRCLRDSDGQMLFKSFIDNWRDSSQAMTAEEYFDSLILTKQNEAETAPWIKCILRKPEIIDYASYKKLFISSGHVVLAQRKTPDSHCIDPIFKYFAICCENRKCGVNYEFYDSKGDYNHAFVFRNNAGEEYLVQWSGSPGGYSIKIGDTPPEECDANKMFVKMEQVINI